MSVAAEKIAARQQTDLRLRNSVLLGDSVPVAVVAVLVVVAMVLLVAREREKKKIRQEKIGSKVKRT
jgi:hypothetical protein